MIVPQSKAKTYWTHFSLQSETRPNVFLDVLTFSLFVKFTTYRLAFFYSCLSWLADLTTIRNKAFSQGKLTNGVYMINFTHNKFPSYAGKLKRAMYSLKQVA